jgi:hypothetical protein
MPDRGVSAVGAHEASGWTDAARRSEQVRAARAAGADDQHVVGEVAPVVRRVPMASLHLIDGASPARDPQPAPTADRRRHYLDLDGAPLIARTAACLMLLYAQPISRILRLTHDDLACIDGELHLQFGEPASPVPAPIAALRQEVIDNSERRGRGGRRHP